MSEHDLLKWIAASGFTFLFVGAAWVCARVSDGLDRLSKAIRRDTDEMRAMRQRLEAARRDE